MDTRTVLQIAVPVAAAAVATAVAAPLIADAVSGDDAPPDPMPAPDPSASAANEAQAGRAQIENLPTRPLHTAPAPVADPAPVAPTRTYMNPVFDADAPDPSVVRGEDGAYYAFTTETAGLPFQVLRSEDLVHWERKGAAFAGSGPAWIDRHRWAPDVTRTGDHYTMLYSGRGSDGNMRIGYATAATAAGPYQDRGVLVDAEGVGYTIDPDLVETPDGWKLYYGSTGGQDASPGSGHGISEVNVDIADDGTLTVTDTPRVVLSNHGERTLVEGALLQQHDGLWYLFYSDGRWDAKGGTDDYAVKVARSSSPDGPFEKLGTPIMSAGNGFTGPGHMSIATDDSGRDWMLYHAWGQDAAKGRMLMIDPITWKDGWPTVGDDGHPSHGAATAPVVE
ncbi:MAG: family 43 glycosylhydrolase [Thermoleophilia bacterium]|nr:family 43 glycosylhydrolase [Thermoleophilia bacterium]